MSKRNWLRQALFLEQDLNYQSFLARLLPNIDEDTIIGIRTPEVKSIYKEFKERKEYPKFLKELPHQYHEENMIHVFSLNQIKDFDACEEAIESFLPYVNNWAICDSLAPKALCKNRKRFLVLIHQWIKNKHEYTCRFGVSMLMKYFLDDYFEKEYLELVGQIQREEYYVNMMIAWYYATALAKQYKETYQYLKTHELSPWVLNKTIQKARESYRLTDKQKAEIKRLKP